MAPTQKRKQPDPNPDRRETRASAAAKRSRTNTDSTDTSTDRHNLTLAFLLNGQSESASSPSTSAGGSPMEERASCVPQVAEDRSSDRGDHHREETNDSEDERLVPDQQLIASTVDQIVAQMTRGINVQEESPSDGIETEITVGNRQQEEEEVDRDDAIAQVIEIGNSQQSSTDQQEETTESDNVAAVIEVVEEFTPAPSPITLEVDNNNGSQQAEDRDREEQMQQQQRRQAEDMSRVGGGPPIVAPLAQATSQRGGSRPNNSNGGDPNSTILDPWRAALDEIAPPETRAGTFTFTHNMPVRSPYEVDMMDRVQDTTTTAGTKSTDDMPPITLPRVGHVQLLKAADETAKIYDGLDLNEGRFVTVRQLERHKHMRRLRLARRLSLPMGDYEEHKKIYELLCPSKTTFVLHMTRAASTTGDNAGGESIDKLHYYWIDPPNHGSLHAYVIERKRLPEIQSKEYFRQICRIVEFCHARGVIIRDLKLRKFVFADARRQTIKLDDMDETAICPEDKSKADVIDYDEYEVEDDRLCDRHGCPAYVSPEILDLSRKWYSGRASDMWSLGVLLYVLLVGRYPFYDVSPAGLFNKIRQGRIQLSENDGVRLEARLLVRSMLRRDPRDRPTIAEVITHPWMTPKDYRAAFKAAFDSSDCVFWKTPEERKRASASAAAVAAASLLRQEHRGPSPLQVPGYRAVPQQQAQAQSQQQQQQQQQRRPVASSKVVERNTGNYNRNRQDGDH